MPTKRHLDRPLNREWLLRSLAETEERLKEFTLTLYHFADRDDPARVEAERILKQFKELARVTKGRALSAKRVLRDAPPK